jgi:hypothetical protein
MKKRLPTLVVFGAAVMVFMFILFWPSISPPSPTLDSDKDGYPDKIDNCPNVPSNINNGCPEYIGEQIDEDQDGRYAGFQKDSILFDKNDKNPCIPNEKCKFCDADGDGLTYPDEVAKGTNPKKKDTDGDLVNDGLDSCPLNYGLIEKQGCPINISVNLRKIKNDQKLVWNSELNEQELETYLYITCLDNGLSEPGINVTNQSNYVLPKLRKNYEYYAELKITLKQPKAVKISNTTTRW